MIYIHALLSEMDDMKLKDLYGAIPHSVTMQFLLKGSLRNFDKGKSPL